MVNSTFEIHVLKLLSVRNVDVKACNSQFEAKRERNTKIQSQNFMIVKTVLHVFVPSSRCKKWLFDVGAFKFAHENNVLKVIVVDKLSSIRS